MRKTTALVLLLLVWLLATGAAAQNKQQGPRYNISAELKIKGVVEEVKSVPRACTGETATHLMLRTDKGILEVQVAPEAFLKELDVNFQKGDKLEVTVSKVSRPEGDIYLAREVDKDGNALVVRDDKGDPVWTWMKKA